MNSTSSNTRFFVIVVFGIILFWAAAYPLSRYVSSAAFGEPTGAIYNAINVLFTALAFTGVVITFRFQYIESERSAKDLVERSIFELLTTFTTDEFQKVKDEAFLALLIAVRNKAYAEYLSSRLFPIGRKPFPDSAAGVYAELKPELNGMGLDEVIALDRNARLKLDNVLNFFAMLSHRQAAATVIRHVDFAYDWWRPTLWIIAQLQKEIKDGSEEISLYCRNPMLHTTLERLDEIYQYPPITPGPEVYRYLAIHPWLKEQRIDPAFFSHPPENAA
ncbi:hypothetical protein [Erwinia sp. SLM-02]|uniref:hypothetical protein n=1 Tax=Erwinia sp. SLM-02 TaxID=3020057 RepID=UPI003080DCA3